MYIHICAFYFIALVYEIIAYMICNAEYHFFLVKLGDANATFGQVARLGHDVVDQRRSTVHDRADTLHAQIVVVAVVRMRIEVLAGRRARHGHVGQLLLARRLDRARHILALVARLRLGIVVAIVGAHHSRGLAARALVVAIYVGKSDHV